MITNALPDQSTKHSGAEKAAVLLVTLGEQHANFAAIDNPSGDQTRALGNNAASVCSFEHGVLRYIMFR